MLRLTKLSYYYRSLRRSARTGEMELEALDVNRDNQLTQIPIPMRGYILKPNEVYICECGQGRGILSKETLDPKLIALGIQVETLSEKQFVVTVQRPVRVYEGMDFFMNPVENPIEHERAESTISRSEDSETPQ